MTGRLTLPTDADIIDETIRLKNLLGADALRDCDGTEMPEALLSEPVKKYATYYTTRKDNEWAMKHPEEIQQEYLISNRITARGETLRIRLMEGFHTEQLKVNTLDDPKRWWEVIDRRMRIQIYENLFGKTRGDRLEPGGAAAGTDGY